MALSDFKAAIWAFLGIETNLTPRFESDCGHVKCLDDAEIIKSCIGTFENISGNDKNIQGAIERARETLDEVKSLTEYQDGKATRLLTIITFIGAIASLIFSKLLEYYPPQSIYRRELDYGLIATYGTYITFLAFVTSSAVGALLTFWAIKTRFRYPKPSPGNRVKSFLFYQAIVDARPEAWAKSFLELNDTSKISTNLNLEYLKNYVTESYLIAAKVSDKIRLLSSAQFFLLLSIRILLVWVAILAILLSTFPPQEASPSNLPSREGSGQIVPAASDRSSASDKMAEGAGAS